LYWLANVVLLTVAAAALEAGPAAVVVHAAALAAGTLVLRDWSAPARAAFSAYAITGLLYLAYVGDLTLAAGLGPAALISTVLLALEVVALSLAGVYAYETFDALCRVRWRRRAAPPEKDPARPDPFVSLHVPAYSEPPELLIETLDALARLDYGRFEVIVVDNNTPERALWEPVQEHCARLGERFRFIHVSPLAGFKAGACNLALRRTDPRAEIVGIVDADYVVESGFLRDLVPYFRDEKVAFVQTPQDYREFEGNAYLTDCLRAYAYFFRVSMAARNEHNAAIFGGTMGLIRRAALEAIGGWDEWCITEDAEASLRLLQRGHDGIYVDRTYGRGLMPFDFDGYKKQRFRWCFGGIQILRKHWRALAPLWPRPSGDRLTTAQRAWYFAAGLQWFGEPLQLAFAAFLVAGAAALTLGGGLVARPLAEAIVLFPLLFLTTAVVRFIWALRVALGIGVPDALRAAVSMFSLSWVVTQACLAALMHPTTTFLRTSKVRSHTSVARALGTTRAETAVAAVCLLAGFAALAAGSSFGLAVALLCFWQSLYFGSAFLTSLSAIRSAAADARPVRYRRRDVSRRRAPGLRGATAALAAATVFFLMAGAATAPPIAEDFARAQSGRAPLLPLATPPPAVAPAPAAPTATQSPPLPTGPAPTRAVPPLPTAAPTRPATATAPPVPTPASPPTAVPSPTAPETVPVPTPTQAGSRGSPDPPAPSARPTPSR
ncbi:MAG: glycosyltransferase, partial [Dehalococcoidia bacterium]